MDSKVSDIDITLGEYSGGDTRKRIAPILLMNKLSATLIIPIAMARRKGLSKPTNVIIEERDDGILIRKLEI
jgi:hypothetical protein